MNTDRKEYVCPWCLGGGAKLWEWAANALGSIFVLLLRKSSAIGGGDVGHTRPWRVSTDGMGSAAANDTILNALRQAVGIEGQPVAFPPGTIFGRWAEQSVALIGDYDDSGLWHELPGYRNISAEVAEAWNSFIEIEEMKLVFNPKCSCQEKE